MTRSPRSRGKGSRRFPGGLGGARKKARVGAWQHRAKHMVQSTAELRHPVARISYVGVFGESAEHNIYLFDQEMARLRVRYLAEYLGRRLRTTRFTIYVWEEQAAAVAAIAARLRKL